MFSTQSSRAEKQDKGLSIYQIFHHNIILMIKRRLKLPLGDRPNLFLGPKSFLPFICLSKIPLIPAAGRCSEAMARVRPRLLWPRRLRLPRQLAQHPCCCHSACVAQSLILSISPALHMQLALFSMALIEKALYTIIHLPTLPRPFHRVTHYKPKTILNKKLKSLYQ